MNEQVVYYRRLSLAGLIVFVLLIVVQLFWLKRALTLDQAEHQLRLKQLVPEIALEINGINHDVFHSKNEILQDMRLDSIAHIIETRFKQEKIDGFVAFSIFQRGKNGLFRSNAPQLKSELKSSKINACMSCIISFSVMQKPSRKEDESEEEFEERIQKGDRTFQYFRPVENLRTPTDETFYFSIYHEKGIWKSLGSIWYLFLGSILLTGILLLLLRYLIKSLANYKKITQVKDDFFNNMTHEFKTPLSSIRLASRMLKANPNADNKDTYLDLIEKESIHLENQIDQLLEFSLLDKDELEIKKVDISLSDLFAGVEKRMAPMISEKQATFSFSVDQEEIINGSGIHLSNCFCNMIENSLKHGGKGVSINIHVGIRNEKRCISVRDNGPGIEPNHHKKIFDRFYRIQDGNQYKSKGFGIGLSYVQTVVELHDGTIELNTAFKTGTEFLIYI